MFNYMDKKIERQSKDEISEWRKDFFERYDKMNEEIEKLDKEIMERFKKAGINMK